MINFIFFFEEVYFKAIIRIVVGRGLVVDEDEFTKGTAIVENTLTLVNLGASSPPK